MDSRFRASLGDIKRMKLAQSPVSGRFNSQAGIAIGPILFIIAILAILAAAIAAGSGSFSAPTASESAKTKASGLISVGENLRIGMDRLTIENGATPPSSGSNATNFDMLTTDTSSQYDLFSPTGGGISPPSAALAGNTSNDVWHFMSGVWPGLGSSDPTNGVDYFAVLNIAEDVCNEVNNRVGTASTISTDLATNAPIGSPVPVDNTPIDGTKIPAELSGKTLGCFGDSTTSPAHYYFYQMLYVQ